MFIGLRYILSDAPGRRGIFNVAPTELNGKPKPLDIERNLINTWFQPGG